MAVRTDPSPNPNALKFTVGSPVGGPGTYVKGSDPEEEYLRSLLALDGVASVFFTADFITVSKTQEASWDQIVPEATVILESEFPD
jgi:hypothetical protein